MNEKYSTQLWVPGKTLDDAYPIASHEELEKSWSAYTGRETHSTTEVFGVYCKPNREITGIASIDLCEVVRETSLTVNHVLGAEPVRNSIYKRNTWFTDEDETNHVSSTVMAMVQAIMNEGLVEPDKDIWTINAIMQKWKQSGVFIVANTSTLPGCEQATVDMFMDRYMPKVFDALILPRNWDGKGTTTKAAALGALANDLALDLHDVPIVKIDDSNHHITSFLSMFGEHSQAAFFIPKNASTDETYQELHTETSLEAFVKATDFFVEQGVVE